MLLLTLRDAQKFLAKVDRSGGPNACWPWKAAVMKNGYGAFARDKGHIIKSHRVAFFLATDQDPREQCVCHSCDVRYPIGSIEYRKCCNPSHLWLGSHANNIADRDKKGRGASGDRSGGRTHPECIPRGAKSGRAKHPERYLHITGENHPKARIRTVQIPLILQRSAEGETFASIAIDLGVNECTIARIVKGKTWKRESGL